MPQVGPWACLGVVSIALGDVGGPGLRVSGTALCQGRKAGWATNVHAAALPKLLA